MMKSFIALAFTAALAASAGLALGQAAVNFADIGSVRVSLVPSGGCDYMPGTAPLDGTSTLADDGQGDADLASTPGAICLTDQPTQPTSAKPCSDPLGELNQTTVSAVSADLGTVPANPAAPPIQASGQISNDDFVGLSFQASTLGQAEVSRAAVAQAGNVTAGAAPEPAVVVPLGIGTGMLLVRPRRRTAWARA
jgi:uncharacterized membrane protein